MIGSIVSTFVGALLGWLVSRYYFRKGVKESQSFNEQLVAQIKEAIAWSNDGIPPGKITKSDVTKFVNTMTSRYKSGRGWNYCPECASEDFTKNKFDPEQDGVKLRKMKEGFIKTVEPMSPERNQVFRCNRCGHKEIFGGGHPFL